MVSHVHFAFRPVMSRIQKLSPKSRLLLFALAWFTTTVRTFWVALIVYLIADKLFRVSETWGGEAA